MLAATVTLKRHQRWQWWWDRHLEDGGTPVQLSRTAGQHPVPEPATDAGHWRAGSAVRESAALKKGSNQVFALVAKANTDRQVLCGARGGTDRELSHAGRYRPHHHYGRGFCWLARRTT